jgi:hypothetical protein
VAKLATLRRTVTSGWQNKADKVVEVDTVDDVDEVEDLMGADQMVDETQDRPTLRWPTWLKCKLKSCNSVWQLTRRRRIKGNKSNLVKVSQKTVDWQFLVVNRI